MELSGNTILITGGATGIGFALAEEFVNSGNEVIICGRREHKLKEAKSKIPNLHIKVSDLSKEKERESLYHWAVSNFKNVNVLVNNAGIQRTIDLRKGTSELLKGENEVEINLTAPIHLSAYFIPHFLKQRKSAIINVSSGLGFVPMAAFPVYCATKAAIHLFSISLRHQLRNTPIKVFEIIPPMVDTELNKEERDRRGQQDRGIKPQELAKEVMLALKNDEFEIAVGMAKNLRNASRNNFEQAFLSMNRHLF